MAYDSSMDVDFNVVNSFLLTTTTPAPLMCSVSETATLVIQYPDDNLCDILMYTHVHAVDNLVEAVDDIVSFETFTSVCRSRYSKTTCGLSFDSRFITPAKLTTELWREVVRLRKSNVMHLGILNMYDKPGTVRGYAANVDEVLKKLENLTAGTKTRIILGVGFFDYHEDKSWSTIEQVVLAANPRDILVVITCVLTVPSSQDCIAMPPTAMRSTSKYPPTFEKALPLATNKLQVSSKVVVAFSFQMATVIYNMTEKHGKATDALYKNCNSFILGDQSQTCESPETTPTNEVTPIGINSAQRRTLFYSYDTPETMKKKAEYVMAAKNRRAKFTWFLFNVHLTDISKKCYTDGPFVRLKKFRKLYDTISKRPPV
ncbi:uncharacterized protein LOC142588745 [Dermacentor variabilis]|uniref:uncharacterized protein LOC142588745 n=1 Tax=Dermacentor variabilis TaxID=34621 RepID=UPI003F5AE0FB